MGGRTCLQHCWDQPVAGSDGCTLPRPANTPHQLLHPGPWASRRGSHACSCSWTVTGAWRRQEGSCEPGPTNLHLTM